MTQIPAESSVWQRAEEGRVLGTEADFPHPRDPYVSRYGGEPQRAGPGDEELMPPFPEAHRGEWLEDPHYTHYTQMRREHERRLDEDYAAWRRERFRREFEAWRSARPARQVEPFVSPAGDERAAYGDPRDEPRRHLGERDDSAPTEGADTFFERS
jgi:hypothetical protein